MATNYIYPFAQPAVPPSILSTADYAASSVTTTTGYPAETILSSAYMSKAQRQTSAICAGMAQFMADNQGTDITDDLSPAALATIFTNSLGGVSAITQPQFDNSTKIATTAFVQRALGNLANSQGYAVNTALTNANVGGIVVPTAGSLGFTLPAVSGLPNGAQITFDGNTYGCVIARQGSDVINAGSAGAVSSLSLEANDTAILTVVGGVWTLTGGELHQGVSSSFSKLFTTNGWAMQPNGLIMQWGQDSVSSSSSSTGHTNTINLSIPWPNSYLTGSVNFADSAPGNGGTNPVLGIGGGASLSTIHVYLYASSSLPSELVCWQVWGY